MAEPFSILSAAAGLADVSIRTSVRLRNLALEFKNAPQLILALSIETTDVGVVLQRVNDLRQTIGSLGELQHDAAYLRDLGNHLNNARAILTELETLASVLRPGSPAAQGFRWLRQKKHAVGLRSRLKDVREQINELLISHHTSLQSRIRLELHQVRLGTQQVQAVQATAASANHNFKATMGELATIRSTLSHQHNTSVSDVETLRDDISAQAVQFAGHKREVGDQLSIIRNTMDSGSQALSRVESQQARHFDHTQAIQVAILNELAAIGNSKRAMRRAGPMVPSIPVRDSSDAMIHFSMRLRGSRCVRDCPCRCHMPAPPDRSLRLPRILQAAIGSLFVGFTGYPSTPTRCDKTSCARGTHIRLQACYAFPRWWFLNYVVHAFVEASMAGTFTFAIVTTRRVPFAVGTILYTACYGSTEALRHLLQQRQGYVRDILDIDGRNALQLALPLVKPGNSTIIENLKLLLLYGADPDHANDAGSSFKTSLALEKLLNPDSPYYQALEAIFPLSEGIEGFELSYVHKVVLGMVPISLTSLTRTPVAGQLNAKDAGGRTPLMYAASRGDLSAVKALIEAGADVNEVNVLMKTVLHCAVSSGAKQGPACVDAILRAGADPNAYMVDGQSCLHLAAFNDQVEICRSLIQAGANPEIRHKYAGNTPMTTAAAYGALRVIRYLYSSGASLESLDHVVEAPLYFAVQTNSREAICLLLRLGASCAPTNRNGQTLLHFIARFGSIETIKALTDVEVNGINSTARDVDGSTAEQLFEKRQPEPELRAAFALLLQTWCDSAEATNEESSGEEECFYDAVEEWEGDENE